MAQSNNVKLKDYFKQAENVIENNLKIIMPYMLIYILVNVGIDILTNGMNTSVGSTNQLDIQAQMYNSFSVWVGITLAGVATTIFEIIVLLKTNTGLDFVEDKKVNGSISVKIGRMILAQFIVSSVISVIVVVFAIIGVSLFAINQGLGALFFILMSIPFLVLMIFISIIMRCVNFEIIVKNTQVIESLKAAYINVMKSKNKTLSKILVGVGVQFLVIIAIAMLYATSTTGARSYISLILVDSLQAAIMVYFLAYNLIVYMSSEV